MPIFDITHPVTGQTISVEGAAPPDTKTIDQIFAANQPKIRQKQETGALGYLGKRTARGAINVADAFAGLGEGVSDAAGYKGAAQGIRDFRKNTLEDWNKGINQDIGEQQTFVKGDDSLKSKWDKGSLEAKDVGKAVLDLGLTQLPQFAVGGVAGKVGGALGKAVSASKLAPTVGAYAGNMGAMAAQETGSIYNEQKEGQKDLLKAAITGVPAGALEGLSQMHTMSRGGIGKLAGLESKAERLTKKSFLIGVAKSIAEEGATEGAQNILEQSGRKPGYDFKKDLLNTDWTEVAENAIGGAVMGGGVHTLGSAGKALEQTVHNRQVQREPDSVETPILSGGVTPVQEAKLANEDAEKQAEQEKVQQEQAQAPQKLKELKAIVEAGQADENTVAEVTRIESEHPDPEVRMEASKVKQTLEKKIEQGYTEEQKQERKQKVEEIKHHAINQNIDALAELSQHEIPEVRQKAIEAHKQVTEKQNKEQEQSFKEEEKVATEQQKLAQEQADLANETKVGAGELSTHDATLKSTEAKVAKVIAQSEAKIKELQKEPAAPGAGKAKRLAIQAERSKIFSAKQDLIAAQHKYNKDTHADILTSARTYLDSIGNNIWNTYNEFVVDMKNKFGDPVIKHLPGLWAYVKKLQLGLSTEIISKEEGKRRTDRASVTNKELLKHAESDIAKRKTSPEQFEQLKQAYLLEKNPQGKSYLESLGHAYKTAMLVQPQKDAQNKKPDWTPGREDKGRKKASESPLSDSEKAEIWRQNNKLSDSAYTGEVTQQERYDEDGNPLEETSDRSDYFHDENSAGPRQKIKVRSDAEVKDVESKLIEKIDSKNILTNKDLEQIISSLIDGNLLSPQQEQLLRQDVEIASETKDITEKDLMKMVVNIINLEGASNETLNWLEGVISDLDSDPRESKAIAEGDEVEFGGKPDRPEYNTVKDTVEYGMTKQAMEDGYKPWMQDKGGPEWDAELEKRIARLEQKNRNIIDGIATELGRNKKIDMYRDEHGGTWKDELADFHAKLEDLINNGWDIAPILKELLGPYGTFQNIESLPMEELALIHDKLTTPQEVRDASPDVATKEEIAEAKRKHAEANKPSEWSFGIPYGPQQPQQKKTLEEKYEAFKKQISTNSKAMLLLDSFYDAIEGIMKAGHKMAAKELSPDIINNYIWKNNKEFKDIYSRSSKAKIAEMKAETRAQVVGLLKTTFHRTGDTIVSTEEDRTGDTTDTNPSEVAQQLKEVNAQNPGELPDITPHDKPVENIESVPVLNEMLPRILFEITYPDGHTEIMGTTDLKKLKTEPGFSRLKVDELSKSEHSSKVDLHEYQKPSANEGWKPWTIYLSTDQIKLGKIPKGFSPTNITKGSVNALYGRERIDNLTRIYETLVDSSPDSVVAKLGEKIDALYEEAKEILASFGYKTIKQAINDIEMGANGEIQENGREAVKATSAVYDEKDSLEKELLEELVRGRRIAAKKMFDQAHIINERFFADAANSLANQMGTKGKDRITPAQLFGMYEKAGYNFIQYNNAVNDLIRNKSLENISNAYARLDAAIQDRSDRTALMAEANDWGTVKEDVVTILTERLSPEDRVLYEMLDKSVEIDSMRVPVISILDTPTAQRLSDVKNAENRIRAELGGTETVPAVVRNVVGNKSSNIGTLADQFEITKEHTADENFIESRYANVKTVTIKSKIIKLFLDRISKFFGADLITVMAGNDFHGRYIPSGIDRRPKIVVNIGSTKGISTIFAHELFHHALNKISPEAYKQFQSDIKNSVRTQLWDQAYASIKREMPNASRDDIENELYAKLFEQAIREKSFWTALSQSVTGKSISLRLIAKMARQGVAMLDLASGLDAKSANNQIISNMVQEWTPKYHQGMTKATVPISINQILLSVLQGGANQQLRDNVERAFSATSDFGTINGITNLGKDAYKQTEETVKGIESYKDVMTLVENFFGKLLDWVGKGLNKVGLFADYRTNAEIATLAKKLLHAGENERAEALQRVVELHKEAFKGMDKDDYIELHDKLVRAQDESYFNSLPKAQQDAFKAMEEVANEIHAKLVEYGILDKDQKRAFHFGQSLRWTLKNGAPIDDAMDTVLRDDVSQLEGTKGFTMGKSKLSTKEIMEMGFELRNIDPMKVFLDYVQDTTKLIRTKELIEKASTTFLKGETHALMEQFDNDGDAAKANRVKVDDNAFSILTRLGSAGFKIKLPIGGYFQKDGKDAVYTSEKEAMAAVGAHALDLDERPTIERVPSDQMRTVQYVKITGLLNGEPVINFTAPDHETADKRIEELKQEGITFTKQDVFKEIPVVLKSNMYVHPELANILNVILSKDTARQSSVGSFLMNLKNNMTLLELSWSAFHMLTITAETIATHYGWAAKRAVEGRGTWSDWSPRKLYANAEELKKAAFKVQATKHQKDGGYINTPEAKEKFERLLGTTDVDVIRMVASFHNNGGMFHMDETLKGTLAREQDMERTWKELWAEAKASNKDTDLIKLSFTSAKKALMGPTQHFMEDCIPKLKFMAYAKDMSSRVVTGEKLLGRPLTETEYEDLSSKIMKFTEDKFGEVNWKNGYMKKNYKFALQFLFRSFTWVAGNIKANIKGVSDLVKLGWFKVKGEEYHLTEKGYWGVSQVVVHTMTAGAISAAYEVALAITGGEEQPTEDDTPLLTKLLFPRINPYDNSKRINIPSYVSEGFKIISHLGYGGNAFHPSKIITGRFNSTISGMADLWKNEDFRGVVIRNPDDNFMVQTYSAIKHFFPIPMSLGNLKKEMTAGESLGTIVTSLAGLTDAPTYAQRSAAANLAFELGRKEYKGKETTQDEIDMRDEFKRAMKAYVTGDKSKVDNLLAEGKISNRQYEIALTRYPILNNQPNPKYKDQLSQAMQRLTVKSALKVYEKMSDSEKEKHAQEITKKINNMSLRRDTPMIEQKKLIEKWKELRS